ncbi:MAG: kynurenine 3-monooxygenase [Crocinitomicaceae bacterium]|jgi:kynurenine 3-monooxygenase
MSYIVVIGAGPIGCAVSTLLARKGYSILLLEKREDSRNNEFNDGRSTHLVLSERSKNIMLDIGLQSSIKYNGIKLKGRCVHITNRPDLKILYSKNGRGLVSIHRKKLNDIFIDRAILEPNININFSSKVTEINEKNASISYINLVDGNLHNINAKHILACDGANSVVRHLLGKRFLLKEKNIDEDYQYKEIMIEPELCLNWNREFMQAFPGGEFSFFAFPNKDKSWTGTLIFPKLDIENSNNDMDLKILIEKFKTLIPVLNVPNITSQIISSKISVLSSKACSNWVLGKNVTLIGDAARSMLPFLGQGLNSGIQDVEVFVNEVDNYSGNFHLASKEYFNKRKDESDSIIKLSKKMFKELTLEIGSSSYQTRKKMNEWLVDYSPDIFSDFYNDVAFTCGSYNKILTKSKYGDIIIDQLIQFYPSLNEQDKKNFLSHVENIIKGGDSI